MLQIKKAGERGFLFTRRCQWHNFLILLYQVPGLLLFCCFKRPEVGIYLHLVLAFEVGWHSPRVPAGAASPILEVAGGKHRSGFIDNLHLRCRDTLLVLCYHVAVLLACLADDGKTY